MGCGANLRYADMLIGCAALPSGFQYRLPDCGRSSAVNSKTPQAELSLTDAVHQFDAGDRDHRVALGARSSAVEEELHVDLCDLSAGGKVRLVAHELRS